MRKWRSTDCPPSPKREGENRPQTIKRDRRKSPSEKEGREASHTNKEKKARLQPTENSKPKKEKVTPVFSQRLEKERKGRKHPPSWEEKERTKSWR